MRIRRFLGLLIGVSVVQVACGSLSRGTYSSKMEAVSGRDNRVVYLRNDEKSQISTKNLSPAIIPKAGRFLKKSVGNVAKKVQETEVAKDSSIIRIRDKHRALGDDTTEQAAIQEIANRVKNRSGSGLQYR